MRGAVYPLKKALRKTSKIIAQLGASYFTRAATKPRRSFANESDKSEMKLCEKEHNAGNMVIPGKIRLRAANLEPDDFDDEYLNQCSSSV